MAVRKKTSAVCERVAYRFYGIPSDRDAILEDKTFGCCRYLWNRMLGDHNTLYAEIGSVPANTPADYKDLDECFFLKEVDSLALANTALNLDMAFSRFFEKTGGYPRFKSKKWAKRSYTTNAVYGKSKGTVTCNIRLDESAGLLKLSKHRDPVRLKLHRKIRSGGVLKSVTVTQEPDGKRYYSILMEYPKRQISRKIDQDNGIGLDYSMPKLYVDSHGIPRNIRNLTAPWNRNLPGNRRNCPVRNLDPNGMRNSAGKLRSCMRKPSISAATSCISCPVF